MLQTAKGVLNDVFGYAEFRGHQQEIIATAMAGRDTLVLQPTGGGKSLCYQIPALLGDGVTLVVSPLIALMRDQVSALREAGVEVTERVPLKVGRTAHNDAYLATKAAKSGHLL